MKPLLLIIALAKKLFSRQSSSVTIVRSKGDSEEPLAFPNKFAKQVVDIYHPITTNAVLPSGYLAAGVKVMREMDTEATK